MNPSASAPIDILRRHWGYDSFRPLQAEIIASVLSGCDTLGLLPTGGGKSLTFQVPALALPGITVVVTPLISLMKDQVDNLRARDICAVCLNSAMTRAEQKLALDRCRLGHARLLYVSPEKLASDAFADTLRLLQVSLIVVDEAHCISQWGHDFRPSYLRIARLRGVFPQAPVLALTASATPEVQADICRQLEFRPGWQRYAASFARPNISYVVRFVDHKEGLMVKALTSVRGTAIIYVRSRRRARETAEALQARGISADFYHAGLAAEDKNSRQERWRTGATRVMVATNAFGMGIDKPDVRLVVHVDVPPSLEEYYQEAGRAGRDGLPAYALLLASRSDKGLLTRRLGEAFPPRDFIRMVYSRACVHVGMAMGAGHDTVRDFDFDLFCERNRLQPVPARSALRLLSRAGWLDYVDDVSTRSRVMVLLRKEELYALRLPPMPDRLLQLLLRTYTGLFADYVNISEDTLARQLGVSPQQVYEALLLLAREHAVHYVPHSSVPFLYFPVGRQEERYITIPRDVYEVQRERMAARLRAMADYVFSSRTCRVARMLAYFGEAGAAPCGKCDVCRAAAPSRPSAIGSDELDSQVLRLASQPGGHTVAYMASQLGVRPEVVAEAARRMADEGRLSLHPDGVISL